MSRHDASADLGRPSLPSLLGSMPALPLRVPKTKPPRSPRAYKQVKQPRSFRSSATAEVAPPEPVAVAAGEAGCLQNYATRRWMRLCKNRHVIERPEVDGAEVQQLRDMFDHIDSDGSGDIEVSEIENAVRHAAALNPQFLLDMEQIVATFTVADSDGGGSLSFEEFVSVMLSTPASRRGPDADDDADTGDRGPFYEFATLYRREMLLNAIDMDEDEVSVDSLEAAEEVPGTGVKRCQQFRDLFDLHLCVADRAVRQAAKLRSGHDANREHVVKVLAQKRALRAQCGVWHDRTVKAAVALKRPEQPPSTHRLTSPRTYPRGAFPLEAVDRRLDVGEKERIIESLQGAKAVQLLLAELAS
mmetsp:Transcript_463/g.1671  ORF Transcript_463/g.1671 Transcript_463/m.1671 type:complete len:359 (-) Transcript_463:44-1120(-)